jgi:hypothetical protein
MGRTLPTIVQTLRVEEEGWKHFRRALRKEDQEAFDALWRFARYHAAPASMASRPMPFEAAVMAMMVGIERQIAELERRLSEWERKNGRVDI